MTSLKSTSFILLFILIIINTISNWAQDDQKYPSLLWEISGNGLQKPSYLFGTMHVSSKNAFNIGTPFFDALSKVDRVALELEPELWFHEILGGDFINSAVKMNNPYGYGRSDSWNQYKGQFKLETNTKIQVQSIFKESMSAMNELLFRFNDPTGNFEENTWLDMYIYQSAKKLNKETLGLETFKESMDAQMKSYESARNEEKVYEEKLSYEDRIEINRKLEESYRNGDLDALDTLNKKVASASFLKHILYERNDNFVRGLDTLLKQKSIFAAMGAAHLPGEKGVIELLRAKGYTVKPIEMGKRNAKQKEKIDQIIVKRTSKPFTSSDGQVSFSSPYHVYPMSYDKNSSRYITMDIANGLTFIVTRVMAYNSFNNQTPEGLKATIENVLYETIPGEIISKKSITLNGIIGLDIMSKTRRGDINRAQLFFLEDEVIVARLGGSGQKVKLGAGDEFFSSLQIKKSEDKKWYTYMSPDHSFSYTTKGRQITYSLNKEGKLDKNVFVLNQDNEKDHFITYRIPITEPGFLDEDYYELTKIEDGFRQDFNLEKSTEKWNYDAKKRSLKVVYPLKDNRLHSCTFSLNDLGCMVFYSITKNEEKSTRFHNEIELKNPKHSNYYDYVDSTLFFSSKTPWETKDSDFGNLVNYFAKSFNKKKKINGEQFSRTTILSPPNTTEWIEVEYRRKSIYANVDEKDKADYEKDVDNEMTLGKDLIVDSKTFAWEGNNYKATYVLSDTLTSRGYHVHIIFQNRSAHVIKASYDKNHGISEYTTTFISNFKPLFDSLSQDSYFKQTSEKFLSDIMSTDTMVFETANKKVGSFYSVFGEDQAYAIYKKLNENSPPLATSEDKKDYKLFLNDYLYLDKSPDAIANLKKLYFSEPDSSSLQSQVLTNLFLMKTKEATLAAKELLLKLPPIGSNVYPGDFTNYIYDSIELGKHLFPEILELTEYEEYKHCWIMLLSEMVDSTNIDKNIYASYLPYLIKEAKVEFRRLSAEIDHNPSNYEDYEEDYEANYLYEYLNLLYPHKKDPKVSEIFDLVANSTKRLVCDNYVWFLVNKGVKIDDGLLKKALYENDNYNNFYLLRDFKRLDYLPDNFDIEVAHIESSIKQNINSYSKEKIDSVVKISVFEDSIRTRKYTTYYYKYLKNEDNKKTWYIAVIMIQPFSDKEGDFNMLSLTNELNISKKDLTQYDELKKELIDENRDNDYLDRNNYNNYNYGLEDWFDY